MTTRGFRRRTLVLGLLVVTAALYAAFGCGTSSSTYSPKTVVSNQDFSISVSPSSVSVVQGDVANYTVTITSIGGFNSAVSLSASGLPTGATATFGAPTVTATGATVPLAVSTAVEEEAIAKLAKPVGRPGQPTLAGSTLFTVTGTAGALTHSTTATLVVTATPDFSITVTPSPVSVQSGGTASYTVTITSIGGFDVTTVHLGSVQSLPANTDAQFGTATAITGGETIPLTIRTSTDDVTPPGSYPMTLSGTSGNITHGAGFTLIVTNFTVSVSPSTQSINTPGSVTYTVTATSISGFSSPITLTVVAAPNTGGATAVFGTTTITPTAAGATTTLTITASNTTTIGSYLFAVEGTSGNLEQHGNATVVIEQL
jgi:hypothetical protein